MIVKCLSCYVTITKISDLRVYSFGFYTISKKVFKIKKFKILKKSNFGAGRQFQSRPKISDGIREFDATIQKIKKKANCLINGLQYKKNK